MDNVTIQELWQIIGERDVIIFQLSKTLNRQTAEIDALKKELTELNEQVKRKECAET